jgi:myo-inositol catabolism protein IolC
MAITAKLDSMGKDKTGYVAYVQYLDGEKVVDTGSYRYNPDDDSEFREKVGAKVLQLSDATAAVKAQAEAAIAEIVTEKYAEIEAAKTTEVIKK